jgi:pimeloyl-ACP methyl ester carboxylesterase
VHGRQDRLVPVSAARELARRRPDWRLTVIPGVGHTPQMEAPDRWLEAVRGWLDDPAVAGELARRVASRTAA